VRVSTGHKRLNKELDADAKAFEKELEASQAPA
jgi:hypothetical protein